MARKTDFREQVPNILIVCEGLKTEPLYFRAFHVARIHVTAKGLGKSTVTLVRDAIELKSKGDYDQTWVVFDIDDCSAEQVNQAIRLAHENDIQVAYSNQAFELWYLLHYAYYNSSIDRKRYNQILSRKLGKEYSKTIPDMYMRLLKFQDTAIQNAERLLGTYDSIDPCSNDPCTTVFKLVKQLNRYSRDSRR